MPKLTAKKRAELVKLSKLPDSKIDLSDIPEIRELPPNTVIGKFYRPLKQRITIRIDADVLNWVKGSGEGYQTRINALLRQLMATARGNKETTRQRVTAGSSTLEKMARAFQKRESLSSSQKSGSRATEK